MSVIEKLELLRARADTAHKYADVSAAYEACGIVAEIGPAIRQDMIDARRYRWLREHSHLQDGLEFWIDPVIAIDYKPGAQLNGMHETLDAAIDARLASDSEGGES